MRKTTIIIAALCVCLCVLGCGCGSSSSQTDQPSADQSSTETGNASMPNPMTQVGSVEELDAQTGLSLIVPTDATDVSCYIIESGDDDLAEVMFTLDGVEYTSRQQICSQTTDISGMYYTWEKTADETYEGKTYTVSFIEGQQGIVSWYDGQSKVQHSISMGSDASESALVAIAEQLLFTSTSS